jgi:aminoglycoside 3-N-acetyltransferase
MKSLGWVCGGPVAVVLALLDVVGTKGTIVVPAQTPDNRDPSRWTHWSVPPDWWPTIREHLPPYDPALSPCREMGVIAETVRTWPGAVRSPHPQVSFAAVGALANEIVAVHHLTSELGPSSPLGALETVGGRALLLGVGYDRCTAFHLAEYRMPRATQVQSCAVVIDGQRRWITYAGMKLDASDFADLGRDFEKRTNVILAGRVGGAECRLMPIREAAAFAETWMREHRSEKAH